MNPVRRVIRRTAEVAVLELAGDLDVSSVHEAERSLRAMETDAPPRLVLDLRGVTFLDSTALRMIVSADGRARRAERRLVVLGGSESVRRVFRTTLLEWRLEIVDDPSEIEGWGDDHA